MTGESRPYSYDRRHVVYSYDRTMVADSIGDPRELLRRYDVNLDWFAGLESDIPKMREAEELLRRDPKAVDKAVWQRGADLTPEDFELALYWKKAVITFMARTMGSLQVFNHGDAHELFLAILQQYVLPPKIRKEIEVASKFFGKTRLQKPKTEQALETYEKYLKTFRAWRALAQDAITHGRPHGTEAGPEAGAPTKIHAGPFVVVNTGGFPQKTMDECVKVVETAARLLQSHGLGKVCYGDVLVSNTLHRPNILAFYLVQKDELFVRANLRGKTNDALSTVLHELGHRLSYKFLSGKKQEIKRIHAQIARKADTERHDALSKVWSDPELKPKVGDLFTENGETYTVTGFDVAGGEIMVLLARQVADAPGVTQRARIKLEGYARVKGLLPRAGTHSGFVTPYAGTDEEENLAEMVAYYCLDKLPADQVEMLEALL